jgi:hypothetical protein
MRRVGYRHTGCRQIGHGRAKCNSKVTGMENATNMKDALREIHTGKMQQLDDGLQDNRQVGSGHDT